MTEIEQKQQFARDSYKAIRNILYKEHGIDNLARYMTLQVLQETDWGKKPSGKNNYFGITSKTNRANSVALPSDSQKFKFIKNLVELSIYIPTQRWNYLKNFFG